MMKKTIIITCRLVIAFTFIFSGFVKAVDPMGFTLKIEEYLISFGMEWFTGIALPTAIALIAVEFLLGIYLLIGFRLRIMTPLVLIVMSGFTLLTLYTALFNPVSDCGCFGDAVKVTNWETFLKNVVLMVFTIGLFYFRKEFNDSESKNLMMIITAFLCLVYVIGLQIYSYNNLPIIDFRPYKIGINIASGMTVPKGADQHEFETLFIMEKDGERKTFSIENYPYDDSTWVFIDSETRIIKEGYVPPLQNFMVLNEDTEDVTYQIVNHRGPLFLMISYNLNKVDKSSISQFVELEEIAQQKNIPFYLLTSSDKETAKRFGNEHNTIFDYLQCDQTTLKTIVRSNPALLLLYDGTITGKWSFKNIPKKELMDNPLAYSVKELTIKNRQLIIWVNIFIMILIPAIFINRKNIKNEKENCSRKLENEQKLFRRH